MDRIARLASGTVYCRRIGEDGAQQVFMWMPTADALKWIAPEPTYGRLILERSIDRVAWPVAPPGPLSTAEESARMRCNRCLQLCIVP